MDEIKRLRIVLCLFRSNQTVSFIIKYVRKFNNNNGLYLSHGSLVPEEENILIVDLEILQISWDQIQGFILF